MGTTALQNASRESLRVPWPEGFGVRRSSALSARGGEGPLFEPEALRDLFALPSFGEHFGRVLVEAMAMGKAVVATASGEVSQPIQGRPRRWATAVAGTPSASAIVGHRGVVTARSAWSSRRR